MRSTVGARLTRMAAVAAGVSFIVLLHGCSYELKRTVWSRPAIRPETGWVMTSDGRLSGPGLQVTITFDNAESRIWGGPLLLVVPLPPMPLPGTATSMASNRLTLRIALMPDGTDFTFDPGRVRVDVRDTRGLAPSDVGLCNIGTAVVVPAPVTPEFCVALIFDTETPRPGDEFLLRINGVERGGAPFRIPSVHFEKASRWSRD